MQDEQGAAKAKGEMRIDAIHMPPDTRVYVQVGPVIPELNDFAVQTTHGELQEAIKQIRTALDDSRESTERAIASVRNAITRYPRTTLTQWASSDCPPVAWRDWCSDIVIAIAYKHVCDGEPIVMCRPGAM